MIRRPPRSTLSSSSAASDVYKRQGQQIGGRSVNGAEWKERDRQGVDMIKYLLTLYFSVVRRKIADTMPKAIMAYLVKPTMNDVHNVLVEELYKEDQLDELLAETKDVTERRKHLVDTVKALENALTLLNEVVEVGANTVV
eukprot:TRINITY_DN28449_c0_g1_i7.p1 TRINITY_DN28449_c0_g1~~TRINITY_DN28449_c0_g1_i7.p1  ORF type:complete len:141 (-),score=45.98 TRINITY_DN28449_c0_g1_i7:262-684(-)